SHHVHVAFHLRRFPKHWWNQDPSLAIDFHRLAVIIRPGQELLLGLIVRREPRQLALQLLPDFHREDPGVITGFARYRVSPLVPHNPFDFATAFHLLPLTPTLCHDFSQERKLVKRK